MDATAIKAVTQLQTRVYGHTYKHMLSRPSPWSLQSTPIAAQPQVPLCVISQVERFMAWLRSVHTGNYPSMDCRETSHRMKNHKRLLVPSPWGLVTWDVCHIHTHHRDPVQMLLIQLPQAESIMLSNTSSWSLYIVCHLCAETCPHCKVIAYS